MWQFKMAKLINWVNVRDKNILFYSKGLFY